jgi:hypothetical protein
MTCQNRAQSAQLSVYYIVLSFMGRSLGEMPLKIRILIFLLREHFLNTKFVVLVICVIYEVYSMFFPTSELGRYSQVVTAIDSNNTNYQFLL